jgi:Flp pilus assembly protein CpaB
MKRVVLLVLAALVLGGFAAYGTYQVQNQADVRALSKFQTTEVLVTKVDVPALTSIADAQAAGMIEKVKYPTEYLPLSSLRAIDSTNSNDLAFTALPAGHLILAGDFGVQSNRGSSLVIPAGYTALSLDLSIANRTGGFLQPGRRVALVSSVPSSAAAKSTFSTKTLFSGLQVLAVGQNTVNGLSLTQTADNTQNVVTLAVRPSDVTSVLNAVQSGNISLVLLSTGTQVPLDIVTTK